MKARRRMWLLGLLAAMTLIAAGCRAQPGPKGPALDFTPLPLEQAPPELVRHYEQARMLPGLFVLQKDGETYLLLMAGLAPEPGMVVEVIDLRRSGREWRLLAALVSGESGAEYPYGLVKLQAPLDTGFKARLTGPDGEVRELKAIAVTDR